MHLFPHHMGAFNHVFDDKGYRSVNPIHTGLWMSSLYWVALLEREA